ncbi:MAG: hypothetical protein V2G42_07560 [bacterium JZ-2024 1]
MRGPCLAERDGFGFGVLCPEQRARFPHNISVIYEARFFVYFEARNPSDKGWDGERRKNKFATGRASANQMASSLG